MTSDSFGVSRALIAAAGGIVLAAGLASAAQAAYPFEGTWVRANRACTANAPLTRTYTPNEITTPNTHCTIRKIASGSGQFELFETCRRPERSGTFTETIRMAGPDAMVVRRSAARLKIARPLRYIRCTIGAPAPPPPKGAPAPAHKAAPDGGAKPPEPKP